ncbi:MAG: radical SAM protein [Myxococcales bacterium]|nr:radical SAM protein [Myxococcales bacterium]
MRPCYAAGAGLVRVPDSGGRVAKLLTIETGFTCNSRCHYCTQLDYRVLPQSDALDLSGEQIRHRIEWAAKEGYDQIGFSGGEPTIRPDFLDLLKLARSFDFERIGVTTNGRMFAYPGFAERALRAGLDSYTFSIHGHVPEVHDRITHAPGSLEQALAGLRNLNSAAERLGIRLHRMNNQILLPENTHHLKDIVALLAPLGVRLFMVQPFIAQRSNVDDLGRFFVPYDAIVAAVEAAVPELARWGARVKPYNVPNCLLWRFGKEHVEPQFYGITVFREFEDEKAGEFKPFKARQWYRIEDCRTCKEVCPGFRIEQYPQAKMAAEVAVAATQFDGEGDARRGLVFGATELFDVATLRDTVRALHASHGPVQWMTALCEKTPRAALADAAVELAEAGALEAAVLVVQPMDQRFLAQRVLEKGNLEELREGLYHLAERREHGHRLPRLRLLINIGDAVRLLDDPLVAPQWPLLVKALRRAAGDAEADLLVAVPNFPRGQAPPDMERQGAANRALAVRLAAMAADVGLQPRLVTLGDRRGLDPARAAAMAVVEAQLGESLPVEDWSQRLFRHPLAAADMDFVSWMPPWLFERWDLSKQELPAGVVAEPAPGDANDGGGVRRRSVAVLGGRAALRVGSR